MFRHAGIVVIDAERMIAFYGGVFGFQAFAREVESGPFISGLLAIPQAVVETIKMSVPQKPGTLELLAFREPSSREALPKTLTSFGLTHLAMTVADAGKAKDLILRNGGALASEPTVSPSGKAKVFFAKDPEGNFLEIVEELA